MSRRGRCTRSRSQVAAVKIEPIEDEEVELKADAVEEEKDGKQLRRRCSTRRRDAKATPDENSQEIQNKSQNVSKDAVELSVGLMDGVEHGNSPKEEEKNAPSTLSTIDALNIGIQTLESLTSETELSAASKGKRRGRKPKAKKADNETENSLNITDATKKMPFPQTIVNGIISIDMSHINVKKEVTENQVIAEPSAVTTTIEKVEKKKRRKLGKKQEDDGDFKVVKPRRSVAKKRGRPKTPKDGELSSAPSSPVKVPIKRGRKIKPNTSARSATTTTRSNSSYVPYESMANILDIEQDEQLQPEDLIGFEHVETLSAKLYLPSQKKVEDDEDGQKWLPSRGITRGRGREILQMTYSSNATRLAKATAD